jgi:acyl-CoA synthetase (NDP forming)
MSKVQLGINESYTLLKSYGIPVQGELVSTLDEVKRVAEKLGYPVVMKAISEAIVHKSDVGAVFLNLKNQDEVTQAYVRLQENVKQTGVQEIDGILVQKMAKNGFELLIGAKQDPSFGPITMIGLGGKLVELYVDAAMGIGRLTPEDVLRMLSETKAGTVLKGYRGESYDRKAVIDLTVKVSHLMIEHPEIHELDLNPVLIYESGFAIVDSRLIKDEPMDYLKSPDISAEKLESLETIFNAKSAVVVGASTSGTQGGNIVKNCLGLKKLYAVNPKYKTLQNINCYPSLKDLPETPDVGIFAVSAERTVRLFEEFCQLGGKGAIIIGDGFSEIGRTDLEDRLKVTSAKYNVAYIGPNCLGVIDNFSKLNTTFGPLHRSYISPKPNGIGIISQSGGIGMELLEMLSADEIGNGKWVSIGNASSVAVPELLAHMGDDPKIKLIAIYLEGVSDGLKLMRVGREVTKKKPVLVIKGGVGGGAEAVMSHTSSLAGSHEAFQACCKQAGFYLMEELTEDPKILVNVLSMLTNQPKTLGENIAIVTVGGGAGILLADQITEEGMKLAEFTPETVSKMRELIKANLAPSRLTAGDESLKSIGNNPIDLFGDCNDERFLQTLRIIDQDPNTDVIIAAIYFQTPLLSEYFPEKLIELKKELSKPLILSARGFSPYVTQIRTYLMEKNVTSYTVPMIKPMSVALKIWQKYKSSFLIDSIET